MIRKVYIGAVIAGAIVGGTYAIVQSKLSPSDLKQVEIASTDNSDPESFRNFSYDPQRGKILKVHSRGCPDQNFAVLVFASTDDYRVRPDAAKVNQAFPCQKHNTKVNLDMQKYNLTAGIYYYFVADQGAVGSWYNPR